MSLPERTRILVVASAPLPEVAYVLEKLRQEPSLELFVLTARGNGTGPYYETLAGVRLFQRPKRGGRSYVKRLRAQGFDGILFLHTAWRPYLRTKLETVALLFRQVRWVACWDRKFKLHRLRGTPPSLPAPELEEARVFRSQFRFLPLGEQLLLVASAGPDSVRQGLEWISRLDFLDRPELTVLCKSRDSVEIAALGCSRLLTWPVSPRELDPFDLCVVLYTGEPGYTRLKLLPWRSRILRRIAFDEQGRGVPLSWSTGAGLFLRRLFRGTRRPIRRPGESLLVIQSSDPAVVLRGVERLQERGFLRGRQVCVLCRSEEREKFVALGHTAQVWTSVGDDFWSLLRRIRASRFDEAVVFHTGQRGFSGLKILAYLSGARHLLIFNENLDCFYFSFVPWLHFVARRLLHGAPAELPPEQGKERILLLQTASRSYMARTLRILKGQRVFGDPVLTVLCLNDEEADFFSRFPEADHLLVRSARSGWWVIWRTIRSGGFHTVVAIYSGEAVFWKVRLFAFLCGARVLIFNPHLDCFFATPGSLLRALSSGVRQELGGWRIGFQKGLFLFLRTVLLPFRFLYLLLYAGWRLSLQVQRARREGPGR